LAVQFGTRSRDKGKLPATVGRKATGPHSVLAKARNGGSWVTKGMKDAWRLSRDNFQAFFMGKKAALRKKLKKEGWK
jgi:hypothetical protein